MRRCSCKTPASPPTVNPEAQCANLHDTEDSPDVGDHLGSKFPHADAKLVDVVAPGDMPRSLERIRINVLIYFLFLYFLKNLN